MLVLNVGRKEQVEDRDRDLKAAATVIDEQAEYARQAGIRILLEMPHVWQLYYDVEQDTLQRAGWTVCRPNKERR